jgi:hypothetical protein
MDTVAKGEGHLTFDYTTEHHDTHDTPGSDQRDDQHPPRDMKPPPGVLTVNDTDSMVQEQLRTLYQSAREFGKHQLQVRLDCRPTDARMESLFVFPFLSRAALKSTPRLREHYQQLLNVMMESPRDSVPLWHELLDQVKQTPGGMGSTVICQVLVECDEVFWVKDLATGTILQGKEEDELRNVVHLVRFEMVVETIPVPHLIPFEMKQGTWQMTDIDDHLKGNLLL